ncbi:MAG: sugar ABC transporter permease [Oscillospiraceae bacterium]|jgi:multiple sugar transport system permease protein|nr:sugar ABC transporter permease [Oscillospiraceae bacterium]
MSKRGDLERQTDYTQTSRLSKIEPLLYLAPFMIGILVFTLYPVVNVVVISFMEDYNYLTRAFSRLGLGNYINVLSNKYFIQALSNTFIYVLLVVPIATVIALAVANTLNQKLKLAGLFQTAYFLPMVTSVTAVGLAWRFMFNERLGIINFFLSLLRIDPVGWLTKAEWSMPALVIYGIWNILPFTIILLLAGLQSVNPMFYTAARVDGSKGLRIFFRITVPLLAPTIMLTTIVNTISSFKVFNELFPLFKGQAGPFYNLYTVVYFIYEQMAGKPRLGRAASAALVLFAVIFILTMLQLLIQRRWNRSGRM